jgi:uncharacterized membrane protein YhaH (DUF805 family)
LLYWVLRPWRQTFDFRGRATRREYWFFLIQLYAAVIGLAFLIGLVISVAFPDQLETSVAGDAAMAIVMVIVFLVLLIPYLSASIRRIHDHDKSGWMLLLTFVPLVGWIFYLILMLTPGTNGPNSYGSDPRDRLDPGGDVSEVFS